MLKTGRRLESDKFFPLMNVKSQNFLPPIQSVTNVQAVYRSAYSDSERDGEHEMQTRAVGGV